MAEAIDVLLIIAGIELVLIVVVYGFGSPWRQTLQGIMFMASKLAQLLIVIYFALQAFLHFHEDVVKLALVAFLATAYAGMALGVLFAQTHRWPVSKRIGTGLVSPENLERTEDHRR